MQNTTPNTGAATSRLMTFEQTAARIREVFDASNHWLIVFDELGKVAIDRLAKRFYSEMDDGDLFSVFYVSIGGWTIAIAAMSKARMTSRQIQRELRRIDIKLNDDPARDALILTGPRNLDAATILLHRMLTYDQPPVFPISLLSDIPTTDSRIDLSMVA